MTVLLLVLGLASVVAAARLVGRAFEALGQPLVVGEMLAAFVLGAWMLGSGGLDHLGPFAASGDLAQAYREAVSDLTPLGNAAVALFLLAVGVELGTHRLAAEWRTAVTIAAVSCGGAILISVILAATVSAGPLRPSGVEFLPFALTLGAVLSTNGLPSVARLLGDSGLMGHRVASLALASGVFVNAFTFAALEIAHLVHRGTAPVLRLVVGVGLLGLVVGLWAIATRRSRPVNAPRLVSVGAAIGLAAVASEATHLLLGVWALGAFAVGVLIGRQIAETRDVPSSFSERSSWTRSSGRWALPIYFAVVGQYLTGLEVRAIDLPLIAGLVIGLGLLGWALTYFASRCAGLQTRDASCLADLGTCRGLVAMIVALQALDDGLIGRLVEVSLIAVGLVTTWTAGVLMISRGIVGSQRGAAAARY